MRPARPLSLVVRRRKELHTTISSRTPEGSSGRCAICGAGVCIDPSFPPGDAPCPSCGSLIWFSPVSARRKGRRERIVTLAQQIEELSKPSTGEWVFFSGFLKRMLGAMDAPAGIIWSTSTTGHVMARSEQGLSLTGYRENPKADKMNRSLLLDVYRDGKSQMYGAGESNPLPTPTNHLYVVTPLLAGTACLGFLEILQRPNTDPRSRPGYQQFIEQMAGYATRYIKTRQSQA
jgi:hypothetical protein